MDGAASPSSRGVPIAEAGEPGETPQAVHSPLKALPLPCRSPTKRPFWVIGVAEDPPRRIHGDHASAWPMAIGSGAMVR